MLDQADHWVSPSLGVFDRQIVAIKAKEVPHRFERRTLVALLKRVSLRNADHKPHRENDNVILAIRKRILRTRQRAFEKAYIANEVAFSGRLHLKPIVSDDRCYRQPLRLIWQGLPGSLEIA
jgi:hypothetical protein